jgi:Leucine-rich repeat (LRR) protein
MRSNFLVSFSLGIVAICLCIGCAGDVKAQRSLKEGVPESGSVSQAGRLKKLNDDDAGSGVVVQSADDKVFESLEQAFLTPEKVRHLAIKEFDPEMKHLPARLGTLVNLKTLEMSCLEKLEDLPEEIGKLRKLESLIIDNGNGCQMNISLPRSIGQLENLKVLTLYGALDAREIGTEQPLRASKIKRLPQTIANLRNLEELDMGRNGLRSLPVQIGSLHKLKRLGLDYNDLRELPASIGNLKNLRELSLRSNGGVKLPPSLAALRGLNVYLGNNSLKLKDQQQLRRRFPKLVLSFDNEFDDAAANEQPTSPKPKARVRRRR